MPAGDGGGRRLPARPDAPTTFRDGTGSLQADRGRLLTDPRVGDPVLRWEATAPEVGGRIRLRSQSSLAGETGTSHGPDATVRTPGVASIVDGGQAAWVLGGFVVLFTALTALLLVRRDIT